MTLGRSIRIYLDRGEVSGIRHAELVNWTGQAILCPRARLNELAEWATAVRRPGVYFLLGGEQVGSPEVYIGESEDVFDRLKQQIQRDDSWFEAVMFTSKDENLTKSHVKYLESRLVERAKAAGRYVVQNGNQPTLSDLPRADRDAMEEFLTNIPLLLGVLGHRVLDPLQRATSVAGASPSAGPRPNILTYSVRDARAQGVVSDEGFVVLKGSTALKGASESMAPGWIAYKEELLLARKLVDRGAVFEFVEDVLFKSPSAAAAVVYGNNANGRISWKTPEGRTLKELEDEEAATAG